jgi:hypothetical protein
MSGGSQGKTEMIARKAWSEFLVGEKSRDLKTVLIGFQDFLGIFHFFFGYP